MIPYCFILQLELGVCVKNVPLLIRDWDFMTGQVKRMILKIVFADSDLALGSSGSAEDKCNMFCMSSPNCANLSRFINQRKLITNESKLNNDPHTCCPVLQA